MKSIMIIAPNQQIYERAQELLNDYEEVQLELGTLDEAIDIVNDALGKGIEIFISRGGTRTIIQNLVTDMPVLDMFVSPYDILVALNAAKSYGDNIYVIGFDNIIKGVANLGDILGININTSIVSRQEEVREKVIEAKKKGNVDVVLGGSLTEKYGIEAGLNTVPIRTSKETIKECIEDARRLLQIKRNEKEKSEQIKTILMNINEGVIAINKKGEVTVCNLAAEKITGISSKKIIGKHISGYNPLSHLIQIMKSNRQELGQLQKIGEITALTNSIPIQINDKVVGAVITFSDITKIQEYEQIIRKNLLSNGHVAKYKFDDIIGGSKALKMVKKQAMQYAMVDSTVIITGESGTGKELFAHSIHNFSERKTGPFVAVNCSAIPVNLLESELFGYEVGAFTGASKEGKKGLFTLAHKGTIFLDEIGEIPHELQARLLRVLQEKEIRPIGSGKVINIDVRVIAATNRSLLDEVKSGKFRKDLYYRINVLKLTIPNLKDRKEDIPVLVEYFLKKHNTLLAKDLKLSTKAIQILEKHQWNGNIRELENIVERLTIICSGMITEDQVKGMLDDYCDSEEIDSNDETLLQFIKRETILDTLNLCEGNRTLAAKKLGISRTQLWRYLKNLNEL